MVKKMEIFLLIYNFIKENGKNGVEFNFIWKIREILLCREI